MLDQEIVDGIIDIDKYLNANFKILWILREARDEGQISKETGANKKGGWNLTSNFYKNAALKTVMKTLTTRRVLLAASAILSDKKEDLDAFKSLAFINVKKFPGSKTAYKKEIESAVEKNKKLLTKQITAYEPEIIITGYVLHHLSSILSYQEGVKVKLGISKTHHYFCFKDKLFINSFHPSNKIYKNGIYEQKYISTMADAVKYWQENKDSFPVYKQASFDTK